MTCFRAGKEGDMDLTSWQFFDGRTIDDKRRPSLWAPFISCILAAGS